MDEMEEHSERCGTFCWKWRISDIGRRKRSGSGGVGTGLGEGFRACQSPSGLGLRNALQSSKKILRVPCVYFEHQRRVQSEGAAPDYHGHSSRVKVELLLSTYRLAGRLERGL